MTRQQQNDIIISKLVDKLGDQPNVQQRITMVFTQWFQNLVQQGLQQMQPVQIEAPAQEQSAPPSPEEPPK
jgi:hypothetical protein